MEVTMLCNRSGMFETVETFAKRLYQTSKRVSPSLMIDEEETKRIISLLAKYYKEDYSDIVRIIRGYAYEYRSKRYDIQYLS